MKVIQPALFAAALGLAAAFSCGPSRAPDLRDSGSMRFRHHFIQRQLEGDAWGQTALVDLDHDGDLDFVTGRRNGVLVWFEYRSAGDWGRHTIAPRSPSDVGAAVLDVDLDGWEDIVVGGAWYRNPGPPADSLWEGYVFDSGLIRVHDVRTGDLDGDGRLDVVTMAGEMTGVTRSERTDLRWYRIPGDPREPWEMRRIGNSVHSGLAVADMDGDGDMDLVRSDIWLENSGDGLSWTEHRIVGIEWDLASQARVADINGNGRLDVVLSEGEIKGGRVAWFEAPEDPRRGPWPAHILPQLDNEPRGPYHSLAVADFDLDSDLDIFAAEMEFLGERPHRWFIWENIGPPGTPQFRERVILDIGLGAHEAVVGDVDGDGDPDIVSKLWRPDSLNSAEGSNHADYLENLTIDR